PPPRTLRTQRSIHHLGVLCVLSGGELAHEASAVSTYGASLTVGALRLAATRYHSRAEARITTATITMKKAQSPASRLSLKIIRAASGLVDVASVRACARNPSAGSGENTFYHPAVRVATDRKISGAIVTHEYLIFPILMMMVVLTHSAMAASSWFAMPNSGQSELMPPSGSITP